jgi:hypothetical protein
VTGGALWQIFVADPNGVVVELNCDTQRETH